MTSFWRGWWRNTKRPACSGRCVISRREALGYVNSLPSKSQRIVKENLRKLEEAPHPGTGQGEKEKLTHRGETLYRTYDKERVVKILKVMTVEKTHKEYGQL